MSQQLDEEILDPTGEIGEKGRQYRLADRPDSLDGKRIALYSNNKQNSDHFLEGVADGIRAAFPEVTIADVVYKPAASSPGDKWDLIDQVAADADIVLLAYGDCGSCTTYTVYDAIEFEIRGIPTTSFSSEKFIELGRYDALHRGAPGLPLIEFDHPIANLDADEVKDRRVSADIVEETIKALTRTAGQVEQDFASRYSPDEFEQRPQFDQCTISLG